MMRFGIRSLFMAGLIGVAACGSESAPVDSATSDSVSAAASWPELNWAAVDSAMGRTGTMQAGNDYRFTMPRSDLSVTVQGVEIRPSFALGSWLAFKQTGERDAVAMGDLVVTERELDAVLTRLLEGGIGQTAIHKHLPQMTPAVVWTHIMARGNPVDIARTVRGALALTGTPAEPANAAPPPTLDLDTAGINRALGHRGRNNGGVYSVSVPRSEVIHSMGVDVPPSMGLSTALNFQPTGGGRAAINGDFVMTSPEVNPVLATLRQNDIGIVELHHHLTDEEPRLFFLHFWAVDDAVTLATALRAALDQTGSVRAAP